MEELREGEVVIHPDEGEEDVGTETGNIVLGEELSPIRSGRILYSVLEHSGEPVL